MRYVWLIEIEEAPDKGFCIIANNYENAVTELKKFRGEAELFLRVKTVKQIAKVDAMQES